MLKIEIAVPSKTYEVLIGTDILSSAGGYIAQKTGRCHAIVVADSNTSPLFGERVCHSLEVQGIQPILYVIPQGEASKNMAVLAGLLEFMADNNLSRSDAVVALGGGVVGDIAGFAASVYMRGVKFIQLPTTLLAAVDSSVGGKTAVDLKAGKNLAGSFYQPELVICDCDYFDTLPGDVYSDGCAEIIKYSYMNAELFNELKRDGGIKINRFDKEAIKNVVARCVEIKRDVVCCDEREAGPRQILNFGHTLGHAIEKLSGYTISHGRAVAAGMTLMARASYKAGICAAECVTELENLLELYDLSPRIEKYIPVELYDAALSDKKRKGANITIVLPEAIGKLILREMPVEEFKRFVELAFTQ